MEPIVVKVFGDDEVKVSFDPVDGAVEIQAVWKGPTEGDFWWVDLDKVDVFIEALKTAKAASLLYYKGVNQ